MINFHTENFFFGISNCLNIPFNVFKAYQRCHIAARIWILIRKERHETIRRVGETAAVNWFLDSLFVSKVVGNFCFRFFGPIVSLIVPENNCDDCCLFNNFQNRESVRFEMCFPFDAISLIRKSSRHRRAWNTYVIFSATENVTIQIASDTSCD